MSRTRSASRHRDPRASPLAIASVLAHELRTPLTSIYGGAQLIVDATTSPSVRRQAAWTVAIAAERLRRSIEDLVILARWDEPLDGHEDMVLLQHLLPSVIADEAGRHQGVRFVTRIRPDLPAVAGGPGIIEHVLRNLLETAARVSQPDGTVIVEAAAGEDAVRITVIDDGPALSPDEARDLFDVRAKTSRNTIDASGANLRLAVARRLVTALGGEIAATPGSPVSVAFSLPLAREEP